MSCLSKTSRLWVHIEDDSESCDVDAFKKEDDSGNGGFSVTKAGLDQSTSTYWEWLIAVKENGRKLILSKN